MKTSTKTNQSKINKQATTKPNKKKTNKQTNTTLKNQQTNQPTKRGEKTETKKETEEFELDLTSCRKMLQVHRFTLSLLHFTQMNLERPLDPAVACKSTRYWDSPRKEATLEANRLPWWAIGVQGVLLRRDAYIHPHMFVLLSAVWRLTSVERRKYLTFDSSKPSGPCVKSEIITKEHEFFSKYLLLIIGLMARSREMRDNYPHHFLFTQNSGDIRKTRDIWFL